MREPSFDGYFSFKDNILFDHHKALAVDNVLSLGPTWYTTYNTRKEEGNLNSQLSTSSYSPSSFFYQPKSPSIVDFNPIESPKSLHSQQQQQQQRDYEVDSIEEEAVSNLNVYNHLFSSVDIDNDLHSNNNNPNEMIEEESVLSVKPNTGFNMNNIKDIMDNISRNTKCEDSTTVVTSIYNPNNDKHGDGEEKEEEEKIDVLSRECKEYTLFQYFNEMRDFGKGMILTFKDIQDTCYYKCEFLLPQLNDEKEKITNMINNFVDRMLLEFISQDKKGVKVLEIMNKFHQLFITSTKNNLGKNDYERLDFLTRLIDSVCIGAYNIRNDKTYLTYNQPKKRGRRREEDKLEELDEVRFIQSEYITAVSASSSSSNTSTDNNVVVNTITAASADVNTQSSNMVVEVEEEAEKKEYKRSDAIQMLDDKRKKRKKNASKTQLSAKKEVRKKEPLKYYPPFDEYKIFLKTIKLISDHLPRESNHGYYLQPIHQMIRNYDPLTATKVWPLWNVLRAMSNMEFMTDIILRKNFQTRGSTYYCCFSGEIIQDNEDVYIFHIYENDITRFKGWHIDKSKPNREFDSDALRRSDKTFIMKKTRVSPVSLFPIDFSTDYKSHYPEYFTKRDLLINNTKQQQQQKVVDVVVNSPVFKSITPIEELQSQKGEKVKNDKRRKKKEDKKEKEEKKQDDREKHERFIIHGLHNNNDLWNDLFNDVIYYKKNVSRMMKDMNEKLSSITDKTIYSVLVTIIKSLYGKSKNGKMHIKQEKLKSIIDTVMDFIESLLEISYGNFEDVKEENHADNFKNNLNNTLFNGGVYDHTTFISCSPFIQLKNSVFLREIIYLIYIRKSIMRADKSEDELKTSNKFTVFSHQMIKENNTVNMTTTTTALNKNKIHIKDLKEFSLRRDILIVLFDHLFRLS